MGDASRADEIENRLIDFAVRIIKVAAALPESPVGTHIARQMLRCGTSPAPNYAEARGAESKKDFRHKLGIALKELNETSVWLRITSRAQLMKKERLEEIMDENIQLCRILNASIATAKKPTDRRSSNDK